MSSSGNQLISRGKELYYEVFYFNNYIHTNTNVQMLYIIDKDRICTYRSNFECNYFFIDSEGQLDTRKNPSHLRS